MENLLIFFGGVYKYLISSVILASDILYCVYFEAETGKANKNVSD